jgi:hypothetical protein
MTAQSDLPHVNVALGDTLLQVRENSTYPFNFTHLQDDDLVAVNSPVRVTVTGPHRLEVPPSRVVTLNCTAALVVAIEASPQLEYLTQREVLALADDVARRVRAAGWSTQIHDPRVTERDELLLRLRDPAQPEVMSWYLENFASRTARLMLRLRRVHRRGRTTDQDLFLLNLQWRDDALADSADAIAVKLRRADGIATEFARPIQLDAYTRRVISNLPRWPGELTVCYRLSFKRCEGGAMNYFYLFCAYIQHGVLEFHLESTLLFN